MDEEIFVSCYGVHFDHTGLSYLHQQRDGKGVEVFGSTRSPFKVVQRGLPPHRINLEISQPVPEIPKGFLNNHLVDVYLPKPFQGMQHSYCIRVSEYECFEPLDKLANLGSPSTASTRIWTGSKVQLETELALTNLIPLTVLGWPQRASQELGALINFARTQKRKFVVGVEQFEPATGAVDLTQAYYDMLPMLDSLSPEELQIIGTHFFKNNIRKLYELNSTQ